MSLRRQTLWSMMPILVTSVVSIVSVPLYFHVLGDQMYAMWFYVGTLTGAFGFMDLGMGVAVGRFIGVAIGKGDTGAVREYWATGNAIALPFVAFFSVVFVVVGCIWGPAWFKVEGSDASILRWGVFWGGVGLFFSYYGQMWNILAQAHLDFKYLSILRTWVGLATSLGTVLVAYLSQNIATILAFSAAMGVFPFVLLLLRGNRHYKLPLRIKDFRKARLIEMLPYTLKTFGQLLSGSILGSLDRVFLGRLAPAADFAAFGVSQNIGGRIAGLSVAIMGPIFNNTNRGVGGDQSKNPISVYRDSFAFMFPWYSLTIVGVIIWCRPITDVWLGSKYGPAVADAFPWIVTGLCINAMANVSTAQLGSLNRVGTSLITQTIVSLSSAIGVFLGWHLGGLAGSAVGFGTARLVWIIQDWFVRSLIGIPFSAYYDLCFTFARQIAFNGAIHVLAKALWPTSVWMAVTAIVAGASSVAIELVIEIKRKRLHGS